MNRTEADPYGQGASSLVAGSTLQGTVESILEMGGGARDQDTIVRALQAAFNNPERAVEYLYTGIPEQAESLLQPKNILQVANQLIRSSLHSLELQFLHQVQMLIPWTCLLRSF
ncbi:hypothetical protein ACQ4PT_062772 [Festuca glaucescens]